MADGSWLLQRNKAETGRWQQEIKDNNNNNNKKGIETKERAVGEWKQKKNDKNRDEERERTILEKKVPLQKKKKFLVKNKIKRKRPGQTPARVEVPVTRNGPVFF